MWSGVPPPLPVQSRAVEAIPPVPPRILIVDDDESVRDVISVLLREEGYNCVVASGAEMALDLAAADETPLVISDMKMPGKDGLWLLENFRARHPDTAVIMLTGYGDTEAAVDWPRRAPPRRRQDRRAGRGAAQARQAHQRGMEGDAQASGHRLPDDPEHPFP